MYPDGLGVGYRLWCSLLTLTLKKYGKFQVYIGRTVCVYSFGEEPRSTADCCLRICIPRRTPTPTAIGMPKPPPNKRTNDNSPFATSWLRVHRFGRAHPMGSIAKDSHPNRIIHTGNKSIVMRQPREVAAQPTGLGELLFILLYLMILYLFRKTGLYQSPSIPPVPIDKRGAEGGGMSKCSQSFKN
jgi:hypothetical protein